MPKKLLTDRISDNYEIVKILGEGSFGQVLKCIKRDTKETVAVKVLQKRCAKKKRIQELFILRKLRCLDPDKANIVRCHEWFHRLDWIFMVFEVLDISLYDYMAQRKWMPLPLHGIRTVIHDTATALQALKSIGLIHTDLKNDNIMLVDHKNQPFRVKLIDFGLSLETSEVWPGKSVQPLWNRSPEVILGLPFNEAIDIWSTGTVMAEMLLGFPLFPGQQEYDVLRFITDLLGEPPKRLLNDGINTGLFYYKTRKNLVLNQWTLMTPLEYFSERKRKAQESRRYKFSSLDSIKTLKLHELNNAKTAAERNACVELLKEMLQMEPRDRITPEEILEDPFITGSYLSSCSNDETEATKTSESQAVTNKDAKKTKAHGRFARKVAPGIPVLPGKTAIQTEKTTEQSNSMSHQDEITRDPVFEISDSDLKYEKETDNSPSLLDNINSLHTPEDSEPKKKKKKGIRRLFSALRKAIFCCFCVHVEYD